MLANFGDWVHEDAGGRFEEVRRRGEGHEEAGAERPEDDRVRPTVVREDFYSSLVGRDRSRGSCSRYRRHAMDGWKGQQPERDDDHGHAGVDLHDGDLSRVLSAVHCPTMVQQTSVAVG